MKYALGFLAGLLTSILIAGLYALGTQHRAPKTFHQVKYTGDTVAYETATVGPDGALRIRTDSVLTVRYDSSQHPILHIKTR
jgi:hypothetical protein